VSDGPGDYGLLMAIMAITEGGADAAHIVFAYLIIAVHVFGGRHKLQRLSQPRILGDEGIYADL